MFKVPNVLDILGQSLIYVRYVLHHNLDKNIYIAWEDDVDSWCYDFRTSFPSVFHPLSGFKKNSSRILALPRCFFLHMQITLPTFLCQDVFFEEGVPLQEDQPFTRLEKLWCRFGWERILLKSRLQISGGAFSPQCPRYFKHPSLAMIMYDVEPRKFIEPECFSEALLSASNRFFQGGGKWSVAAFLLYFWKHELACQHSFSGSTISERSILVRVSFENLFNGFDSCSSMLHYNFDDLVHHIGQAHFLTSYLSLCNISLAI